MSATANLRKRLDIGQVIQDGVLVVVRNIVSFGLMSLLCAGLPSMLFGLCQLLSTRDRSFQLLALGAWLFQIAGSACLHALLIHKAAEDLQGRQVTLWQSFRMGGPRWLGLVGLSLLETISILLGLVLLIVPGALLILRWSVATSAFVLERRGIRESMRRSAQLTHLRRRSILLIYVLYYAAHLAGYLLALLNSGYFFGGRADPTAYYLIWNPLLSTCSGMVMIGVLTALFLRLRSDKEGGAPEALAEVFA